MGSFCFFEGEELPAEGNSSITQKRYAFCCKRRKLQKIMKRVVYTLLLMPALCLALASCKRHDTPHPTPPPFVPHYPLGYTAAMAGTETMVGIRGTGFSPVTTAADTQHYTIKLINDSTVLFGVDTFSYLFFSAADSSMRFNIVSPSYGTTAYLKYFVKADSMYYDYYSRPTMCCYTQLQLHTLR